MSTKKKTTPVLKNPSTPEGRALALRERGLSIRAIAQKLHKSDRWVSSVIRGLAPSRITSGPQPSPQIIVIPPPPSTMDFGDAIRAMKRGKKVARKGWNGKDMYLWLLPATEVKKEWCHDPRLIEAMGKRDVLPCLGSIRMFTATKEVLTGWLASQTDMLADDWCIVG